MRTVDADPFEVRCYKGTHVVARSTKLVVLLNTQLGFGHSSIFAAMFVSCESTQHPMTNYLFWSA